MDTYQGYGFWTGNEQCYPLWARQMVENVKTDFQIGQFDEAYRILVGLQQPQEAKETSTLVVDDELPWKEPEGKEIPLTKVVKINGSGFASLEPDVAHIGPAFNYRVTRLLHDEAALRKKLEANPKKNDTLFRLILNRMKAEDLGNRSKDYQDKLREYISDVKTRLSDRNDHNALPVAPAPPGSNIRVLQIEEWPDAKKHELLSIVERVKLDFYPYVVARFKGQLCEYETVYPEEQFIKESPWAGHHLLTGLEKMPQRAWDPFA